MGLLFIALCCATTLIVKSTASPDNNRCMEEKVEKHRPDVTIEHTVNTVNTNISILAAFISYSNDDESLMEKLRKKPELGLCGHYWKTSNITASGWRYESNKFTAAHRWLPFNTVVMVTDGVKGVVVRINDRRPGGRNERVLDMSEAAAKALSIDRGTVIRCSVKVLQIGDGKMRGELGTKRPCKLTWFGKCRMNDVCCSGCCMKEPEEPLGTCVPKGPYKFTVAE